MKDILEEFITYFHNNLETFDKRQEEDFREKINFAREHYKKTDVFLQKYYNDWCIKKDTLILPFGVYRTLFYDEWADLIKLWIQDKKSKQKMKRNELKQDK